MYECHMNVKSYMLRKMQINNMNSRDRSQDWGLRLKPELVFINVLARGKRLVQNQSFCESTLKSFFFRFYKCYSQRKSVFWQIS
jgi:hypothetical protein